MTERSTIEAYPLSWPEGFVRTPAAERERGLFKITPDRASRDLAYEVFRLGGTDVIVSTNIPLRRDGLPYAAAREPSDPGAAVYFTWKGAPRAMACDKYDRVFKNLRALGLTIEAMRALTRYGSSEILERAFRGFTALPATSASIVTPAPWWDVLGVERTAAASDIELAFRRAALTAHPDKGGTDEQMQRVMAARETALREIGAA